MPPPPPGLFPKCGDARRIKRAKEKATQKELAASKSTSSEPTSSWAENEDHQQGQHVGEAEETAIKGGVGEGTDRLVAGDELETAAVLRADHRVRSFDFAPTMTKGGGVIGRNGKGTGSRVLVALHNNSLEVWGLEGVATAPVSSSKKGANLVLIFAVRGSM